MLAIQAEHAIVNYFGQGTQIQRCRQFDRRTVGCDFKTPSENVGIQADEGTYSGYVTVRATKHGPRVEWAR